MAVLLLFIDGIGIGNFDPEINPFARYPTPFFSMFKDRDSDGIPMNGILVPTDPSMGIKGLPQSATGQTALFTGVNASQIIGHHISGFPTPTLRRILKEKSIFLQLEQLNKIGTFANALSQQYLNRPERRVSATI